MALVTKNFSDIITFTRASTGTYFNSSGVLTSAAVDQPRFDYNPSTLAARGLLIEEARTNSIRNNTMQGAVAGTPGTLPTNWLATPPTNGITRQILGTGTENGITYIDFRFFGTNTLGSTFYMDIEFESAVAASQNQTWTASAYVRLLSGAISGASFSTGATLILYGTPGFTDNGSQSLAAASNAPLSSQRFSATRTFTNALTTGASPRLLWTIATGATVDFTLRIGLPQLEQGAFATSVIPTTTTALTRSADVASVNTLAPWYNASEGTLYSEITDAAITVAGTSRRIANINDGTEADRITVGWAGVTGAFAAFVTDNSVAQAAFSSPSGAYPFPTKVALAYKAADFQAAVNGSAFATVSSGTVPTVNRMTIGDVVTGGAGPQNLNGHVRRITYYPRRLSQAELTAITT